jgi:phenylpyruvate tautomerase PptA (4-oxalocrotonate tautomerase family)
LQRFSQKISHHSQSKLLIEILTLFAGRSLATKKALYQAIVGNLEKVGVPPHDIKITLIEVPADNWGLRGGQPASEIDLGFKIKI